MTFKPNQWVRSSLGAEGGVFLTDGSTEIEIELPPGTVAHVDMVENGRVHVVWDCGIVNVFEGDELNYLTVVEPNDALRVERINQILALPPDYPEAEKLADVQRIMTELRPYTVEMIGMVSESFKVLARNERHARKMAREQADDQFPDVSWDSTSTQVFEGHDE